MSAVMTSEAIVAGLQLPGPESFSGAGVAKSAESRDAPPLPDMQKHPGAQAAIWKRIKAARLNESATVESKSAAERRSSVPAVVSTPDNLGFVASQAGVRALAAAQILLATEKKVPGNKSNAGVYGLPVPSVRKAIGRPRQAAVFSLRPTRASKKTRPADGEPAKSLWQPAANGSRLVGLCLGLAGRPAFCALFDPGYRCGRQQGSRRAA